MPVHIVRLATARAAWRRAAVMRRLAIVMLLFVCAIARADQIDDYARDQMRQLHIPGLALTVVRDGKVVTTRTYGVADVERKVPVSASTVFEIGSVTKQFTAMAILMLVDEGRIALDDRIGKHLPHVPPAWSAITIRHLLTHSSGIQEYLAAVGVADAAHAAATHEAQARVLFSRLKLEFAPGATWAYSNSGYLLLGHVIERVSGKSYWQFLRERIFTPLGMHATRSSDPRATIPHRAVGYGWSDGRFDKRGALTENAYAAGSIVSTIGDMARWDAALHARKLLSKARYDEMWTALTVGKGETPPFPYAFGWFVDRDRGHRAVFHGGGTPGFSASIRRYLDDGVTVIVLANASDRVLDHVVQHLAGLVLPAVARQRPARDADPARTRELTTVLRGLLAGKPDAKRFTPAMQRHFATAAGSGWWQWIGSHGEFRSLTFAQTDRIGANDVHRYRARFGDAELAVSFTVTKGGKIAQVVCW